jgi:hypothetical protein
MGWTQTKALRSGPGQRPSESSQGRKKERLPHNIARHGRQESSIGIEHVAGENDPLTASQAAASAALIRWLIEQYH